MENELIKIETREGFGRCVSLRELHEGLGIKTQFTKWAIRMIEYGFTENIDFILISQKRLTNNPKNPYTEQTDYIITIDMAKEICMIQRSDIGREFRKYFIECEKQLKEIVQKPLLSKEDELLISIAKATTKETQMIAVGEYGRYKEEQIREKEVKPLQEENRILAPKADYTDRVLQAEGLITTTLIAKDFGLSARKLNDILNKEGVQYKQGKTWVLYSKYQDKGYSQTTTDKDGHVNMKWTQVGKKFIVELLQGLGYTLNNEK